MEKKEQIGLSEDLPEHGDLGKIAENLMNP